MFWFDLTKENKMQTIKNDKIKGDGITYICVSIVINKCEYQSVKVAIVLCAINGALKTRGG